MAMFTEPRFTDENVAREHFESRQSVTAGTCFTAVVLIANPSLKVRAIAPACISAAIAENNTP